MKIKSIDYEPFHNIRYKTSGFNPKGEGVKTNFLPFFKVIVDRLPDGVDAIVATSDLQGREIGKANRLLGEHVVEELVRLSNEGVIPEIGAALLAGDLYDHPDCRKLGGSGDVSSVWHAFSDAFPIVFGVHGNHDVIPDLSNAYLRGSRSNPTIALDGEYSDFFGGMSVGGVSGIIGKPTRNQRKTPEQFYNLLDKVMSKRPDVLLLHHGPDSLDSHQRGDAAVRERFEKNKAASLVLFGHCHWPVEEMWVKQGNKDVLNVDGRVIVFVEEK